MTKKVAPYLGKYPSLTAVVRAAVMKAPSGLTPDTIADKVGKLYSTLTSELRGHDGHKLGVDYLLPLITLTEDTSILKFIAREMGGVFVLMPEAGGSGTELVGTLAKSVKEFGEFATEVAVDISDGDIPADQLARINKEADEAIESIIAMKKLARITQEARYGVQK